MDSRSTVTAPRFRPSLLQEFLHISALSSFSIAQPILDNLANNVAFLRYYDYSPDAVMIAIALLLFAIPVVSVGLRLVLDRTGLFRLADLMRVTITSFLFFLAVLFAARWATTAIWKSTYFLLGDLLVLPVIPAAGWCVWLYYRSESFRYFLSFSAVGILLFPTAFFMNPAIQEQVLLIPAQDYYKPVTAKTPANVVFIVFDGLSGMALLNENHEVDRLRYPAFAKLGDHSNYYRNASTVHPRTDHAVPAILAASFPKGKEVPVESEYPLNLFRVVDNTRQFHLTIFEPYTQMAPQHLQRLRNTQNAWKQATELLDTSLRVYERICLPKFAEYLAVEVPREWFRILPPAPADPEVLDGKILYAWDTGQDLQTSHFLKCLRSTEKPALRFFHIVLPHDPWTWASSGRQYRDKTIGRDVILGEYDGDWCEDEWLVNQGWQRYLHQVQYADMCLGRILDRLEETNLFSQSLIVVTADHGFGFRAGSSRRDPEGENIADLISVPLFIKLPHQTQPLVSDRNVESIDVVPTIADVLGLPQDPEWDGQSVLANTTERPRKTVVGSKGVILEAAFPGKFRYVERLHDVFGKSEDRVAFDLQFLPELYGVAAASLVNDTPAPHKVVLYEGGFEDVVSQKSLVPAYLRGQLTGFSADMDPAIIAVTVNGIIRATTRTSTASRFSGEWTVLIPPDVFTDLQDQIGIYFVEKTTDGFILRELPLEQE